MKQQLHHRGKYHIRYSQNFLRSSNLAKKIVDLADIKAEDTVIEIGAGKGALTRFIIPKSKNVIAIEKDKELCKSLKTQFQNKNNITIINQDFLEFKLPSNPYKIIGNIPFNITSDIIRKLLEDKNPPRTTILLVQKEAALRLTQTNLFSLKFEPWFKKEILLQINAENFYPRPQVSTVVIKITKREKPLVDDNQKDLYYCFLDYCFSQWKKDVKGILKKLFTYKQLITISKQYKINLKLRPTELNMHEWISIFLIYEAKVSRESTLGNF